MKKIIMCFIFLISFCVSSAQTNSNLDLEAYFTAIIVSNIEESIDWYSKVLGFEVIDKVESTDRGFKQSNLKREEMALELIELDRALDPKEVIPNYDSRTRLHGFFKNGFLIGDFDEWITHLTNMKVDFYGNVVSDPNSGKRMSIITDPDGNRIQLFEK